MIAATATLSGQINATAQILSKQITTCADAEITVNGVDFVDAPSGDITDIEVVRVADLSPIGSKVGSQWQVDVPLIMVADFAADNTTPRVGETVTFTPSATESPNVSRFGFGDGTFDGAAYPGTVQKVYEAEGSFDVDLTVGKDEKGDYVSKSGYINVSGLLSDKAVQFNGSPQHCEIPDVDLPNFGTTPTLAEWTIRLRVRFDDLSGDWCLWDAINNTFGSGTFIYRTGSTFRALYNTGVQYADVTGLIAGHVYDAIYTKQAGVTDAVLSVYDVTAGSLLGSATKGPSTGSAVSPGDAAWVGGQNNSGSRYGNGYIDEVVVCGNGISSAQITDLHNGGVQVYPPGKAYLTDLRAWYRMGEGDTIPILNNKISGDYPMIAYGMTSANIISI